jgi:hypothetical protein
VIAGLLLSTACSDDRFELAPRTLPACDLSTSLLSSSLPADAIPSLLQPTMFTLGQPELDYLRDSDRILGVVVDGQPRAYPHRILWHHEIVSDRVGGRDVAATFCPLTGSGVVFDPRLGGETLDVGVSGLLYANNLVLYDRTSGDVYGPQLEAGGRCSRFRDAELERLPVIETSWGRWRRLHLNTVAVSDDTGFERNYERSPYGDYDALDNDELLFPMPTDDRRPLKERVLVVGDHAGVGFPFSELALGLGDRGTLETLIAATPTVIFWEATGGATAVAFEAALDGQTLSFEALEDGTWRDVGTGSVWTLDGRALTGPLAGRRLRIRTDAFVAFWFAFRHFRPDAGIWISDAG